MWTAVIGAFMVIAKVIAEQFSDSARLRRLQIAVEKQRAEAALEAERLQTEYERVKNQSVPTTPEELAKDLTKEFTP